MARAGEHGEGVAGRVGDLVAERMILTGGAPAAASPRLRLAVVTGGRGLLTTAEGERSLSRGSVALFRPGEWRGYSQCDALQLVEVGLDPALLRNELVWLSRDPIFSFFAHPQLHAGAALGDVPAGSLITMDGWLTALSRSQGEGAADRALRIGYLTLLLAELAAVQVVEQHADQSPVHPMVLRALHLLEQQLEAEWTLTTLAHVVNLAPAYLTRLFRKQVGLPPMAYLNRLRAERVGVMLIETDLSIAAIGESVGWSDRTSISRRFRAVFSVTPAEYRVALQRREPSGSVKNAQQQVTEWLPKI